MSYINKNYWDTFYKKDTGLSEASTFSEYILREFSGMQSQFMVIDLGCGTGKDSFYFAKNGFETIGIDGSEEVTKINNSKIDNLIKNSISFHCADLSDQNNVAQLLESFNEKTKESKKQLLIYTRFFLHAIPEEVEDIILENLCSNIETPFIFVSEFRTKEDEVLDKVYNNHYRRYVETDKLLLKLLGKGFSIKNFTKGQGFSIYKNEDPYLARITVEKKKNV
ncbi:class I SAM-dependent methyltransferase [Solibacillus sp. FSL W8-0372]|uniref:class I SAM-dependent methyltransferase n=1 Tax=Solibacillus sp. FSL W8-0372 TaxID=2921713 RepID=UPI0030CF2F2D